MSAKRSYSYGKTSPADMEKDSRSLRARHTLVHEAMATTFRITLIHGDPLYARQAAEATVGELDRIEALLSRFVETSDIARVNNLGQGQQTSVQRDAFDCLRIAQEVQRETAGAFDVAYSSHGGWSPEPRFELDEASHSVRALCEGLALDLGAIGKGFALDRMAALAADWDIAAAFLAASTSTVLAIGSPPGKEGWPIAFGPDQHLKRLRLNSRAFSGSGTAVKGSHILDPRTRTPATGRFRAWAGAPSAAMSDALSTAFMVLAEPEIRDYCRRHPGITAWWQESSAAESAIDAMDCKDVSLKESNEKDRP